MSKTAAERAALGKQLLAVISGGNPDNAEVAALIAAGASLEETADDLSHRTPLLAACSTGRCEEAAALLLKAGANPEARNKNGATALMSAVLMKNEEMVDLLIAHKAKIDDDGFKGMTPLMWAANLGARGIVRKLLAAGADADIVSRQGKTAADYAEANGKPHVAKEIAEGARVYKSAKAAFDAALAAGVPLEQDITPLHLPALKRRAKTARPTR